MYPYNLYLWLELAPILIVCFFYTLFYIVYIIWTIFCAHGHVHNFELCIVNFALKDLLVETRTDGKLYVQGRRVRYLVVRILVIYVVTIAVLAFAVGWDTFLIEASYACDPGLDCFINAQPIQNCSELYESDNYTNINGTEPNVICYRIAADYALAAAAVGGLLGIGKTLMGVITSANNRIYDQVVAGASKCCLIACLQVWLLVWLPILVVPYILKAADSGLTFKDWLQYYTILTTTFIAALITWVWLPSNMEEYTRLEGAVNAPN